MTLLEKIIEISNLVGSNKTTSALVKLGHLKQELLNEESKGKEYMVLVGRGVPIDPNEIGIIDESDNPLIHESLESARNIQFAYNEKNKDDDWGAWIVELKEVNVDGGGCGVMYDENGKPLL